MKQETQSLLIHVGGVLVIALAVWVSTLIKGTDDAAVGLRVMLIGGAAGLYGKLGFKPAGPVLDVIIARMAQQEPERVQRLTSTPPPRNKGVLTDEEIAALPGPKHPPPSAASRPKP